MGMESNPLRRVEDAAVRNRVAQRASLEAAEAFRDAVHGAVDAGLSVAAVAEAAGVSASRVYAVLRERAKV